MATITDYTTKSGKKYYKFQLYVGTDPLTGRRIKTTRSKFRNKKEAEIALSRLQLEIEENGFNKVGSELFEELAQIWLKTYKNTVKESTYVKTNELFKHHIIPSLGKFRIDKITIHECQNEINKWFQKLKNFRVVRMYASKVFDLAIRMEIIKQNPMNMVVVPQIIINPLEEEKINYYTKEQLMEFLNYTKQENNLKRYTYFRLLAFSGVRRSEALALTWRDVDFTNQTIKITKNLARGENSKLIITTPKTRKSVRTIKMDKVTMNDLNKWKKQQKAELTMLAVDHKKTEQLVFNNNLNEHIQISKPLHWLRRIQKKYKLHEITVHGFRHTHASLLFEAGVSIKEASDRLGHSDIRTTMNIYTHVTAKTKDKVAQKLESYMNF